MSVEGREKRTWYLSLEDGEWNSTRGPDMIFNRYQHACNSFTFNNELILAVVGGAANAAFNVSEFLSYYSEKPQWDNRDTELDLPYYPQAYAQLLVSNGETLFYINTWTNVFFRLKWNFEEGFQWVAMNLRLETQRGYAVGVLIPDTLTNCTKTAIEIKDVD